MVKPPFALGKWPLSSQILLTLVTDYSVSSPPPATPFWQNSVFPVQATGTGVVHVRLELEPAPRTFLSPSPVDPAVKYPESMVSFG